MKKQKSHAFNKDCYLLGMDKYGTYYWLEQSTFNYEWHWSIGYIETYTNNKSPNKSRDINSHNHFNSMFMNGNKNTKDMIKEFFIELTLNDDELWKLCEIMYSLYTFREYSDTIHRGGSHFTNNPCKELIRNEYEYNRINKIVIPALLKELYKLLSE